MNILNGASKSFIQCVGNGSSCANNVILSIIYIILVTVYYAILWAISLLIQSKRNKRLAKLLFLGELIIVPVALFNLFYQKNMLLGIITNLSYLFFLVWINILCYKYIRYGNQRIRVHKRNSNDDQSDL